MKEYQENETVVLKVNSLTSVKTQLPFGYYTLPYCKPVEIQERVENLGEILAGDKILSSPYELHMKRNVTCKWLCYEKLEHEDREKFRSKIRGDYMVNWIVDNLPATTPYQPVVGDKSKPVYMNGFPVGQLLNGKYYVHNHVKLTLFYHQPEDNTGYRIVGFQVEPQSIKQATTDIGDGNFEAVCPEPFSEGGFDLEMRYEKIHYTYDVKWVESTTRWATRWDSYLQMEGSNIHWLSILNSGIIVLCLTGIIAMILLRTLHRDIAKYNELATTEEIVEETGWKLVHGDVFRKPQHSKLLAASVGCGVQIIGMSVVTLFFAALGLLAPARRGALLQSTLLLFTFMGAGAGYCSARLCKFFECDDWKQSTIMTAMLYPGIVFGIFFFLNLLIWGQSSAGAVPFATMFALLVLWFGISLPLVFLGAYLGFRKPTIEVPVRTSKVPRQIPEQPWFMQPTFTCMAGGVLPFVAVFTELFFIMSSMWRHRIYYVFGFLAVVLVILIITCAEISIALTYVQLTSEDYNWWWRSFLCSGSSAGYVFLYSIFYFSVHLQIDKVVSVMLYFGYMFIVSLVFFLATGAIGMLATFCFARSIYGSIKVD